MSEGVDESMVAVGGVSNETSKISQDTAILMNTLNKTAHELREAVEIFKVEVAQAA